AFLFAEDDVSGVANTLWSINGSPYVPAYPITFPSEGTRMFEFYSVDRAGNTEEPQAFSLTVDMTAPEIDLFEVPPTFRPQVPSHKAGSNLIIRAQATDNSIPVVDLKVEIMEGNIDCETFPET